MPKGEAEMNNWLQSTAIQKLPLDKLKVLDTCQHIFKYAEEFYLHLAEIHREQREIARIWGLMAIDKCNHSETFKMASRLRGQGVEDIVIPLEVPTNILIKMKLIPKAGSSGLFSVEQALRFAITMEERLEKVHFRRIVRYFHEQDMELMASPLKSSSSILQIMTEEYVNLTLADEFSQDDEFAAVNYQFTPVFPS